MKSNSMVYYRIKSFFITITYIIGMLLFSVLFANNRGSISVFAEQNPKIVCPILLYYNVSDNAVLKEPLTITRQEFESDLEYLTHKGFEPVFIQDLIDYVYNGESLPAKPVILSFDNGYHSFLENVLPILKEYNIKAVVSVIGYNAEISSQNKEKGYKSSYLTWDEISGLYRTDLVEIQNQSYNMNKNERSSQDALYADTLKLNKLLQERSGVTPMAYTYSLSCNFPSSENYLKELGFRASLTCEENVNIITTPASLFGLCRYCRVSGIGTEEFMEKIMGDLP